MCSGGIAMYKQEMVTVCLCVDEGCVHVYAPSSFLVLSAEVIPVTQRSTVSTLLSRDRVSICSSGCPRT